MVSAAKGDTCIAHDVCSCKRNGKDMVSLRPLDLSNGIKYVRVFLTDAEKLVYSPWWSPYCVIIKPPPQRSISLSAFTE